MDLSRRSFDEILVEQEGFAFKVEVVYEKLHLFCSHHFLLSIKYKPW